MPTPEFPSPAPEVPRPPQEIAAEQARDKIHSQLAALRQSIDQGVALRGTPQWNTFVDSLRSMQTTHGATETWRTLEGALVRAFAMPNPTPGTPAQNVIDFINDRGVDTAQQALAKLAAEITPGRGPTVSPAERLAAQVDTTYGRIRDVVGRLSPKVLDFLGGAENATRLITNLASSMAVAFSGNGITRAFAPQIQRMGTELALRNQLDGLTPPPTEAQLKTWRSLMDTYAAAKRQFPDRLAVPMIPDMRKVIGDPAYPKQFTDEIRTLSAAPAPTTAPNAAVPVNVGGLNFPNATAEMPVTVNQVINGVRGQNFELRPDGQISIQGNTNIFRIRITNGSDLPASGAIKLLPPASGANPEDVRVVITQGTTIRNIRLSHIISTLLSRPSGSTQTILQINADNSDAVLA